MSSGFETTFEQLLQGLDELSKLRVMVVGETIIDEYAYCEVIGKSGKEPTLVGEFSHVDVQAGGVLAIANHLADFCPQVQVHSALGEFDRREGFVRSSLKAHLKPQARFATVPGACTIVKRRYLDTYSQSKLLGVYRTKHAAPAPAQSWIRQLREGMQKADLVLVADYGHGLISSSCAQMLSEDAKYLAVNCQMNASNLGYHVVSKYPKADFVCVHEGELRLDARDRHQDLEVLMANTQDNMNARAIMITRGKRGTLLRTQDGVVHRCRALADSVVERVGAGDAVLSMASIAAASGLSAPLVGLLANLAGARLVSAVGNGVSVDRAELVAVAKQLLPSQARTGSTPAMDISA